ncbi:hypothetical protein O6H91_18G065700 [Diphasiastrum complanatum]|uniref:Uncharacterized protein n=1 Tax=Diphasiastrum complanatum TaxID=34168 RepID=A0ACC2B269_DIPCM|nr:hypothetical protein O6H91_18G065700 [Diphasiastrum complanatum]
MTCGCKETDKIRSIILYTSSNSKILMDLFMLPFICLFENCYMRESWQGAAFQLSSSQESKENVDYVYVIPPEVGGYWKYSDPICQSPRSLHKTPLIMLIVIYMASIMQDIGNILTICKAPA